VRANARSRAPSMLQAPSYHPFVSSLFVNSINCIFSTPSHNTSRLSDVMADRPRDDKGHFLPSGAVEHRHDEHHRSDRPRDEHGRFIHPEESGAGSAASASGFGGPGMQSMSEEHHSHPHHGRALHKLRHDLASQECRDEHGRFIGKIGSDACSRFHTEELSGTGSGSGGVQ